jgi:hypothetical protein
MTFYAASIIALDVNDGALKELAAGLGANESRLLW